MPYAIAHPAAIIPLHRWLGRRSVPSALVIGSVVPDAWYFVPLLGRPDTHTVHGALLYCLPLALLVYALYHLIAKEPLLALLPRTLEAKLRACTVQGLPPAPWSAVALCAAAGALTHVVWDSFTHAGLLSAAYFPALEARALALGAYELRWHQLLQHLSTLSGGAFVAWWIHRSLGRVPVVLPLSARGNSHCIVVALALLAAPAAVLIGSLPALLAASGVDGLRSAVRAAVIGSAAALAAAFAAYCLLWHGARVFRRCSGAQRA